MVKKHRGPAASENVQECPDPLERLDAKSAPRRMNYDRLLGGIAAMLDEAHRVSVCAINDLMTASYWENGRRMVEFEQRGKARAEYGSKLLKRLSSDLTSRFGRGLSVQNLENMRLFYQAWDANSIS
jgi:hypothetical protein